MPPHFQFFSNTNCYSRKQKMPTCIVFTIKNTVNKCVKNTMLQLFKHQKTAKTMISKHILTDCCQFY